MSRLPVIVGFGGYNAAGRSSFHHGFRRTVIESLDAATRQETLAGLAVMTKLVTVVDGQYLDADGKPWTCPPSKPATASACWPPPWCAVSRRASSTWTPRPGRKASA